LQTSCLMGKNWTRSFWMQLQIENALQCIHPWLNAALIPRWFLCDTVCL
jgi:hypothetical protein